jgi:hypothetical protein
MCVDVHSTLKRLARPDPIHVQSILRRASFASTERQDVYDGQQDQRAVDLLGASLMEKLLNGLRSHILIPMTSSLNPETRSGLSTVDDSYWHLDWRRVR